MSYGTPSRPALITPASASGITVKPTEKERVIPVTLRPDGTARKERKVRPGFTPAEDVTKFKTKSAAGGHGGGGGGGGFGGIVGMAPQATDAQSTMSKAQKKNEKRKERRLASAWDHEDSQPEESPKASVSAWDDDDGRPSTTAPKKEARPPRSLFRTSMAAISAQQKDTNGAISDKVKKIYN